MNRYRNLPPAEVMRLVTTEIIDRAIRFSRKTGRTIRISKTSRGEGVDVGTLDSRTPDGREALEAFLATVKRQYTISGLGAPEEPSSVNWRKLNLPVGRRWLLAAQLVISMVMRARRPRTSSIAGWGRTSAGGRRSCRPSGWTTSGRSSSSSATTR